MNRQSHWLKEIAVAGTALIAAAAMTACAQSDGGKTPQNGLPAANPDLKGTVTIGAVLPLTGVNATIGKDQQRGIDLAVATINSKDGVLGGKKLQVKIEDSEGRAPSAIQAARKLVSVDKVPVVLGEYSSGNTIPMQQFLQKSGVVGINVGSSSIDVRTLGDYQFSVIGLDDVAGSYSANALNDRGYKSIAILAPNNSYGSGIVKSVSDAFTKLGGNVAAKELYTEGQSDYRQELNRLKKASPDAYVLTTYGKDGTTINKEAYELGMTDKPVFDIYMSQDIPDADPASVEGRRGMDVNAIADSGKDYRAAYKKAFGEDFITSFNGLAYDAVQVAALAIDKAGSVDANQIQAALTAVSNDFVGVTGPIIFDKDGQRSEQPYVLATVKDGKIIPE